MCLVSLSPCVRLLFKKIIIIIVINLKNFFSQMNSEVSGPFILIRVSLAMDLCSVNIQLRTRDFITK